MRDTPMPSRDLIRRTPRFLPDPRAAILGALGALLVAGLGAARPRVASAQAARVVDGLLIQGGVAVRREAPDEAVDILLEHGDDFLLLRGAVEPGGYETTDTLDAAGLFIHSANPFLAEARLAPSPNPVDRTSAMYVLRTGASPASPARWLVGPYGWRRVEAAENHPAGPVDGRAGCYALTTGEWGEPGFVLNRTGAWFPDSLRLTWQYQWPYGTSPFLVATDGRGRVRGKRITYYGWKTPAPDSLEVMFSTGFQMAWFLGTRAADTESAGRRTGAAPHRDGGSADFTGELAYLTDGGTDIRATARLTRIPCPESSAADRSPPGRARSVAGERPDGDAEQASPAPSSPRWSVELEGGPVWQSYNDVEIPNDGSATRFSLYDLAGAGPWAAGRVYVTWNFAGRHGLRLLLAPLTVRATGVPASPISFAGEDYAAGMATEATYTFNSYRLTYRYRFHEGARTRAWIGFTAKVRDAVISLEQGATTSEKTDLGFVPLLHLAGDWRVAPRWTAGVDIDALAGGPGRAEDASLKLGYDLADRWSVRVGYRMVEGGADVEPVYTFAWLHYAVASVVLRL